MNTPDTIPLTETRKIGRPRKLSWKPCAICGQPDGPIREGRRSPTRMRLEPFGLTGEGCHRCVCRIRGRKQSGISLAPEVLDLRRVAS